ncbi:hypothetical protein FRAAL4853 [Frankia alni ACN14a]|uniref:Uncharacterized protein n=1 Tax=Frankia alni (strain DSM 45986 / CECT 9034 / ACN14a) TaxID=326424 RepID=Q0RG95_FRAAA|nr:hypothetical protein FRAAL4853 [Frankia alni ACN14a]
MHRTSDAADDRRTSGQGRGIAATQPCYYRVNLVSFEAIATPVTRDACPVAKRYLPDRTGRRARPTT